MSKWNVFFYDEIFHTRNLTKGYLDDLYDSDSYIGGAIGWNVSDDDFIRKKFYEFEERYKLFYNVSELKSTIFKEKSYKYGIASLKKDKIQFYKDYLNILDKVPYVYISVISKLEYILKQITVLQAKESYEFAVISYSLTKALRLYRPEKVLELLFAGDYRFLIELKKFLVYKISEVQHLEHKQREVEVFKDCIRFIEDCDFSELEFQWDYLAVFDGLGKHIKEMNLQFNKIILNIDNEGKLGEESNTFKAAKKAGFFKSKELDSQLEAGIRIADLFCGLVGRIIRSLNESMVYKSDEYLSKKLLEDKWFEVSEEQFDMYILFGKIFFDKRPNYFTTYTGNYSDDIINFMALIGHFYSYENFNIYKQDSLADHAKKFELDALSRMEENYDRFGIADEINYYKNMHLYE